MSEPKKNTLKNTFKENSENQSVDAEKKSRKKKKDENNSSPGFFSRKLSPLFSFLHNEQFQKIFGLLLLLFSVYLTVAFTSFLFTWDVDQDKVLGDLFSQDVQVQNWLGKFGALLSHVFIYKWFGIASYLFAFVSFLLGAKIIFRMEWFALRKVYSYSTFFYCLFQLVLPLYLVILFFI